MRVSKLGATLVMAAAGILLAACGQKGPLYLPDQGGEVVTRPGGQAQGSAAPQTKPDDQKKQQAPR